MHAAWQIEIGAVHLFNSMGVWSSSLGGVVFDLNNSAGVVTSLSPELITENTQAWEHGRLCHNLCSHPGYQDIGG
jgi:hypothetical protein